MHNLSRAGTYARWLVAVPLLSALAGCSVVDALGLQKPGAKVVGVGLDGIDLTAATLRFDVEVSNPYSAPLPLVNLDYGLASKGKAFLSGKADLQGTVPAGGKKTFSLPAKVTYKDLLAALSGVRPGSVVPYEADLGLSVNAPVAGPLRLPLKKKGQLPVPAAPDVSIEEIRWDDLTLSKAGGTIRLNVANRNQFPVELAKLAYGLNLADVKVAETAVAKPLSFAADGGAQTLEIPISLSPSQLGLAAWNVLSGKGADYKLVGAMDVKTPFGPMNLPIAKIGRTVFKRK